MARGDASALSSWVTTRDERVRRLVAIAERVAPTLYPVLLQGETGTGKELFARGIHAGSGRRGPFVAVNCAAIPEGLFEAELFGARRGAYTSLGETREGLIRAAHGGTLFLDEVGEMPLLAQGKLLRILEEGEVRPLGATEPVHVDVRIIAATHRDLEALVRAGRFRRDLFYRLSVATLHLLPLRERRLDIPLLVDVFVTEAAAALGRRPPVVAPDVLARLVSLPWQGNLRQLSHAVAAAILRCSGDTLTARHFGVLDAPSAPGPEPASRPFAEALAEFERGYLERLLDRTERNLSRAARVAGLSRTALRDKARRHGLL